ncbi:hypothetical protein [Pseudonocardia sp.]|uniref:hypothetical protein n=1 Tax=Pseudonocardia sp. TaxID=60912 RepID=UPI00260C1495|nr:hypothetical protein [Pseudonocardia sp.]
MPARIDRSRTVEQASPTAQTRMITSSSVVTNLTVRAAGLVPVRLDLAHVGTAEQQLGVTLGTVLIYINSQELHQAGGETAGRLVSMSSEWLVSGRCHRPLDLPI